MIKMPNKCPNCYSSIGLSYERFSIPNEKEGYDGEYICNDCEWSINASNGEVTYDGNKFDGTEYLKEELKIHKKALELMSISLATATENSDLNINTFIKQSIAIYLEAAKDEISRFNKN